MNVFVVIEDGDYAFDGVFATLKGAKARMKRLGDNRTIYTIYEWDLCKGQAVRSFDWLWHTRRYKTHEYVDGRPALNHGW